MPCKNPNCKSFGSPHPNCRCYGGMAEGGEVSNFCDSSHAHNKGCEYYAEGSVDAPVGQDAAPTWDNTAPIAPQGATPSWEDSTPVDSESSEPATDQEPTWESTEGEYDAPMQQLGAGVEGVAKGIAGPLATLAEKGLSKLGVPGLSDEDIKGREEANPWTHGIAETVGLGAGLATGVGEAALIGKASAKLLPEAISILGKYGGVGATALKAFVTNAAIGAGDEVSQAMLGQGNPEHPVASALANVGISGLIGGITGGLFEGGSKLASATDSKLGSKAASWLAGFGAKSSGAEASGISKELGLLEKGLHDERAFKAGYNSYDKAIEHALTTAAGTATAGAVYGTHGVAAPAVGFINNFMTKVLKTPIEKAGKMTVPTVTKWLSEGAPSKLLPLLNYATKVEQGNKLLNSSVGALFREGNKEFVQKAITPSARDEIDDWVKNGGVNQDIQEEMANQASEQPAQYAEGGDVKPAEKPQGGLTDHPVATIYPEQNMLLHSAKGRIYNYLNSIRPQENQPKLAFDSEPDQRDQKRSYNRALDIAIQPMSILKEIKQGTIEMEHVKHFNALYPDLGGVVQNKLTQEIAGAQMKGEKPSYKIRQGLSLLMGTPLSSEMTPSSIQAAQSVYAPKPAPMTPSMPGQQAAPSKGGSTTKLTKSSQAFLTGNQSRVSRSQQQ